MTATELEHSIEVLTHMWAYKNKEIDFSAKQGRLIVWSLYDTGAFHTLGIIPFFSCYIKYVAYNSDKRRCELHLS